MRNRGKLGTPRRLKGATLAVIAALVSAGSPVYGAANNPPVISGTPPQSIYEKASYSFRPTARDPDGNALRFQLENRPHWMRLDTHTGAVSGIPTFEDAGVYRSIRLLVRDGRGGEAALGPFTVTVKDVNRPPKISGYAGRQVFERGQYSFTPSATDADSDNLTFSIARLPHWARFDRATGTLSGTPGFDDAGRYSDISISVFDGSESVSLPPFTLTVRNTNRDPSIAGTPRTSIPEGQAYAFTPKAKDPDGDRLLFSATNLPPWAKLDRTTGAVTGTPGFEDQGEFAGVTLTVRDGKSEASLAPFSVTVKHVNQPPTIAGRPILRAVEGGDYQFIPNAEDADGDDLIFNIVGLPRWAAFDSATGTLSGVPPQGSLGFYDGIAISVSDGKDVAEMDPFSIYVYNDGESEGPRGFYSLNRVVPLPFVDGVVARKNWSDVERNEGVYDFSHIEDSIREAEAVGQRVVIAYLLHNAPKWLLNAAETFLHNGEVTIVPWDETMLAALERLVFALAEQEIDGIPLGEHPAVAHIHATIGGITGIRLRDLPQGYTPELFEESVLRSLRIWASAFPEGNDFIVGLFGVDDDMKNPSTAEHLRELILQEFDGINQPQVHFFQELLTGVSPQPQKELGEILMNVDGRAGIAFQACGAWSEQNGVWKQCNWLEPVDTPDVGISNGLHNYGARYFEFYSSDLLNEDYYDLFMNWHMLVHE